MQHIRVCVTTSCGGFLKRGTRMRHGSQPYPEAKLETKSHRRQSRRSRNMETATLEEESLFYDEYEDEEEMGIAYEESYDEDDNEDEEEAAAAAGAPRRRKRK